jgi:hypothetical protein
MTLHLASNGIGADSRKQVKYASVEGGCKDRAGIRDICHVIVVECEPQPYRPAELCNLIATTTGIATLVNSH